MKLSDIYIRAFSIVLMMAVMVTSLRVELLAGAFDEFSFGLEEGAGDGNEKSPDGQEGEEERESKKDIEEESKGWLENQAGSIGDRFSEGLAAFIHDIDHYQDAHHPSILIPPPDFI